MYSILWPLKQKNFNKSWEIVGDSGRTPKKLYTQHSLKQKKILIIIEKFLEIQGERTIMLKKFETVPIYSGAIGEEQTAFYGL